MATWAGLALLILGGVVFPWDGPVSDAARSLRLGGDLRRELEALQQYGQGASILLVVLLIWALDPPRRRRLLDYALAIGVTALAVMPMKLLVGRPRPKFGDPEHILGPLGVYPVGEDAGLRHAWEVGSGISSDLWSMPSSHTAYAVVLSVFLTLMYPKLRWIAVGLALLVGVCRVLFGAHYPSDVLVGGGLALLVAPPIVRSWRGVRLLDWLWVRLVDKNATPAWPGKKS
ncbi:MAG: phosphatase PAP2 family protein [Phycisphaerales bacterium JB059]